VRSKVRCNQENPLASSNSGYAGIRYALPVVPPLAVLGAVAMVRAAEEHSGMLSISIAVVSVAAIASAVPVMRPWEYYNELIGAKNAYRHFNDESLEVEQRTKELAAYYHGYLEPKGEIPYVDYKLFDEEEYERRGVHSLQMLWKKDESLDTSDVVSGTLIVNAKWIAPDPWFDISTLRAAEPAERFGNLLIYRGTFRMTQERAGRLFFRGIDAVYAQHPDSAKAEKLFREAMKLDPGAYFIYVELGNLLAQKGARDEAMEAYKSALYYAPTGEKIMDVLKQQIDRISREDPKSVPPVRDPFLE
jgi:tetratricopeptide (TPR) repeat protein